MIHFPSLNAGLNATSAILLAAGFVLIKKKRIEAHRLCMLGACLCSAVFLACYLYYHYHAGSTRFAGPLGLRPVYFTILLSHTILAVIVLPMVLVTLFRAWRGDFVRHANWAKWTWPVWIYVSVTGVVVYWMLYRL